MIAKQYTITLPADYDMGIVRHRVATRGPAFDHFPDLVFKAFLIREKVRGAVANEYAPFYVWPDSDALWPFVAGPGFQGIVDSFGWMPIRTWHTLDVAMRRDVDLSAVLSAEREETPIAPGTDLVAWHAELAAASRRALAADPALVVSVVAADLDRWTTVRFRASLQPPYASDPRAGVDAFEVLRFCAPDLARALTKARKQRSARRQRAFSSDLTLS